MGTLTPQKFSSAGWFQGDCRKIKEQLKRSFGDDGSFFNKIEQAFRD